MTGKVRKQTGEDDNTGYELQCDDVCMSDFVRG